MLKTTPTRYVIGTILPRETQSAHCVATFPRGQRYWVRWNVTTHSPTNHVAVIARSRNDVNITKKANVKMGKTARHATSTGTTSIILNWVNQQLSVHAQSNLTAQRSSKPRGPHSNHTGTAIPTAAASLR